MIFLVEGLKVFRGLWWDVRCCYGFKKVQNDANATVQRWVATGPAFCVTFGAELMHNFANVSGRFTRCARVVARLTANKVSKVIDPRSGGAGEEWSRRNSRAMIRSSAGPASFRMGPMPLIYRTTLLRHVLLLGDEPAWTATIHTRSPGKAPWRLGGMSVRGFPWGR